MKTLARMPVRILLIILFGGLSSGALGAADNSPERSDNGVDHTLEKSKSSLKSAGESVGEFAKSVGQGVARGAVEIGHGFRDGVKKAKKRPAAKGGAAKVEESKSGS